jgi:hypothetical protein
VTDRNIRYLLDQAFERLRADGYFAEPDWTCCRSCGVYELPPGTEDYVFFNLQDAEHLRERGDVYLNHGGDGEHIVRRLREAGLRVDWDGSDDTAIHVSMPEQTALGGTDIGMEDGKWERAHRLHEHIHNMIAEDDVPLPEVAVVACVLMIGGVLHSAPTEAHLQQMIDFMHDHIDVMVAQVKRDHASGRRLPNQSPN